MNLLQKKPNVKDQVRATSREVRTIQRELGKDRSGLERQEKQIIADIKKAAKQGRTAEAKTLAKQLLQLRKHIEKNTRVNAQVGGLRVKATTMASQAATAKAMSSATRVMAASNKATDLGQLQKTMMQFGEENTKMDMKDDMINDVLDSMMDEEGDQEESQNIMNAVFDEIGLDLTTKAAQVPRTRLDATQSVQREDESDALMKRLAQLKS
ncbi:uncharacterized protein SPPG_07726 [Spizellomyces punctatus DAOM BR117]|uniref:Uncharacterized protein n=1 Tax=Spizellomyces punctatus (strain DAOM BR117) TaxID=645134 RepID=A0A0L0H7F6_SPIPD|nr:uncharacterized protein SPPG_07726 [Spizellomyces punctatus DAOM BR117]KNC96899.1 hypothetical protein SPPG_07726 [Spizellomyces punctatus DAOM BR117]|eukprot:XP_016604939.1 hypothetical protein SPPG_07726 [Spizellomyces punctatus DAOM BR117]